MTNHPAVFCAIDTAEIGQAIDLAKKIGPVTGGIKLGMEFFNAFGPAGVKQIIDTCPNAALFIDLKFHDIPNTVAGAVRAISKNFKPAYLNVHAAGGAEMMKAAKDACAPGTKLLAVTVLTSLDDKLLQQTGHSLGAAELVSRMALLAKENGLDGVVCSAHEIKMLRDLCGPDFALMVPGIRPAGAETGDQKRVMTPKEAMAQGATHLVIGRPITGAADPAQAARDILDSLQ